MVRPIEAIVCTLSNDVLDKLSITRPFYTKQYIEERHHYILKPFPHRKLLNN